MLEFVNGMWFDNLLQQGFKTSIGLPDAPAVLVLGKEKTEPEEPKPPKEGKYPLVEFKDAGYTQGELVDHVRKHGFVTASELKYAFGGTLKRHKTNLAALTALGIFEKRGIRFFLMGHKAPEVVEGIDRDITLAQAAKGVRKALVSAIESGALPKIKASVRSQPKGEWIEIIILDAPRDADLLDDDVRIALTRKIGRTLGHPCGKYHEGKNADEESVRCAPRTYFRINTFVSTKLRSKLVSEREQEASRAELVSEALPAPSREETVIAPEPEVEPAAEADQPTEASMVAAIVQAMSAPGIKEAMAEAMEKA
jgi:hypothetical protein